MKSSYPATRRIAAAHARAEANRLLRRAPALLRADPAHPDATLLAKCDDYAVIRKRLDGLFSRATRIVDEDARAEEYDRLSDAGEPLLRRLADLRAKTPVGHGLRAAAFLAWDEGDLLQRAQSDGLSEERLLAAILIDLVTVPRS